MIDFSKLLPILTQSKTQRDNPALYQVVESLINGLKDLSSNISQLSSSVSNSSGLSVGPVTTLSDAQIKAWPTTLDIPIVTSNVPIIPDFVVVQIDARGGAYTNLSPNAYITLSTNSFGIYEIGNYIINDGTGFFGTGITRLLGTATVSLAMLREETDSDPNGWGSIVGVYNDDRQYPLYIRLSNPTGDLTGGNAANSMKITPVYIKIPSLV